MSGVHHLSCPYVNAGSHLARTCTGCHAASMMWIHLSSPYNANAQYKENKIKRYVVYLKNKVSLKQPANIAKLTPEVRFACVAAYPDSLIDLSLSVGRPCLVFRCVLLIKINKTRVELPCDESMRPIQLGEACEYM